MAYANSSTDYDDFTTGEVNAFTDIPEERWRDGKQFHVLSYLGRDWGRPGCRYDLAFLADYVSQVNEAGGVVTIDIALSRDVITRKAARCAWRNLRFTQPKAPSPLPTRSSAWAR
jgi:hypothetical protein